MFCPKCGKENMDDARFCGTCGNTIPAVSVAQPSVQAPIYSTQPESKSEIKMTFSQILFSFKGRIPRSTYWTFLLPMGIIGLALQYITDPALRTVIVIDPYAGVYIGKLYLLYLLLTIYPGLAIIVKRIHDRNRSAWFLLVFLIPIVGLWPAIEIPFLKGTTGPNKYGNDPLSL